MKKLSGDLTGQHFTQKSIIHLMCESVVSDLKKSKSKVFENSFTRSRRRICAGKSSLNPSLLKNYVYPSKELPFLSPFRYRYQILYRVFLDGQIWFSNNFCVTQPIET